MWTPLIWYLRVVFVLKYFEHMEHRCLSWTCACFLGGSSDSEALNCDFSCTSFVCSNKSLSCGKWIEHNLHSKWIPPACKLMWFWRSLLEARTLLHTSQRSNNFTVCFSSTARTLFCFDGKHDGFVFLRHFSSNGATSIVEAWFISVPSTMLWRNCIKSSSMVQSIEMFSPLAAPSVPSNWSIYLGYLKPKLKLELTENMRVLNVRKALPHLQQLMDDQCSSSAEL